MYIYVILLVKTAHPCLFYTETKQNKLISEAKKKKDLKKALLVYIPYKSLYIPIQFLCLFV